MTRYETLLEIGQKLMSESKLIGKDEDGFDRYLHPDGFYVVDRPFEKVTGQEFIKAKTTEELQNHD